MADREKLIELLRDVQYLGGLEEKIADHLIASGVTIQKWIPVTERLPTDADADDLGAVLAVHKASRKKYYHWRSVVDNPFDFTHWMPLPSTEGLE